MEDLEGLPEWAKWTSEAEYLPQQLHEQDMFYTAANIIQGLECRGRLPIMPCIVKGLGLLLRELHHIQFSIADPDHTPSGVPEWFLQSSMTMHWAQYIFDSMTVIQ
jgi:hypothetical protein